MIGDLDSHGSSGAALAEPHPEVSSLTCLAGFRKPAAYAPTARLSPPVSPRPQLSAARSLPACAWLRRPLPRAWLLQPAQREPQGRYRHGRNRRRFTRDGFRNRRGRRFGNGRGAGAAAETSPLAFAARRAAASALSCSISSGVRFPVTAGTTAAAGQASATGAAATGVGSEASPPSAALAARRAAASALRRSTSSGVRFACCRRGDHCRHRGSFSNRGGGGFNARRAGSRASSFRPRRSLRLCCLLGLLAPTQPPPRSSQSA